MLHHWLIDFWQLTLHFYEAGQSIYFFLGVTFPGYYWLIRKKKYKQIKLRNRAMNNNDIHDIPTVLFLSFVSTSWNLFTITIYITWFSWYWWQTNGWLKTVKKAGKEHVVSLTAGFRNHRFSFFLFAEGGWTSEWAWVSVFLEPKKKRDKIFFCGNLKVS